MSYQICFFSCLDRYRLFQNAGFIFNKIEVFVPYSKSLIKSNLKRVAIMRWTCDEYKSVDLCLTWCLEKLIFYYYFSSPRQTSSRLRDDSFKTRPPLHHHLSFRSVHIWLTRKKKYEDEKTYILVPQKKSNTQFMYTLRHKNWNRFTRARNRYYIFKTCFINRVLNLGIMCERCVCKVNLGWLKV